MKEKEKANLLDGFMENTEDINLHYNYRMLKEKYYSGDSWNMLPKWAEWAISTSIGFVAGVVTTLILL